MIPLFPRCWMRTLDALNCKLAYSSVNKKSELCFSLPTCSSYSAPATIWWDPVVTSERLGGVEESQQGRVCG